MGATSPGRFDAQLESDAFARDPYPVYDAIRADAPVYRSETVGAWLLTRYDDVGATLRDPARFGSSGRFAAVLGDLGPDDRASVSALEDHFSIGLLASDPPDHTRLRGLLTRAFTPRVVEALRPHVQALVDGMLDAVLAAPAGDRDLLRDLAYPLPATVIAELLGAPPADRDAFKVWSDGILAFQGTGRAAPELLRRSQVDLLEMRAYLGRLLDERRRAPRDDLLSRMVAAEAEGDRLTQGELLTTCVTLLTAGHETTTNLIANGLLTLLRHPDQLALLRAAPGLMPGAVEEMLRFESPLQRNPRRMRADVELRGETLGAGDFVLQVLGAANRDPEQFPEPHRFDITRTPNRHVAFAMGIHFCLGAPLARLEASIAIEAVLRRMPTLRLATAEVQWHRHGLLRSLTALPVEL